MTKKYAHVCYDWREGGIADLKKALKKLGLNLVEDPAMEDTDCISYFIFEGKPTKAEVKQASINEWGPDCFES